MQDHIRAPVLASFFNLQSYSNVIYMYKTDAVEPQALATFMLQKQKALQEPDGVV